MTIFHTQFKFDGNFIPLLLLSRLCSYNTFAHVMATKLSCHMKNYVAIAVKVAEIAIEF